MTISTAHPRPSVLSDGLVAADWADCPIVECELLYEAKDPITGRSFRLIRSPKSGLTFVHPRPRDADLANYYPQTHQGREAALYEKLDAPPRARAVLHLHPGDPGAILDIGCGKGLLLALLQAKGWRAVGTELSEHSSQTAKEAGIEVHCATVEDAGLTPDSFDVVTMFHSLEHMTNPYRTLSGVIKLLRSGGTLLVEVPNFGSWYARLFGRHWFHLEVPRHLYHFTVESLQALVVGIGFEIQHMSTTNVRYDAFGFIQSALNCVLNKKNLLNNYNTGEVTFTQLWQSSRRWRNVGALALSLGSLWLGYPIGAALCAMLSLFARGGTLRLIARKPSVIRAS